MSSIERSSAPWRQRRTILVTLVVLGLMFGSLFLWRAYRMSQTPAWQQQATAVAAMRVAPQDVPVSLEAIGTLAAVREVSLSSEVAGRVAAIGFEGGAQVGAGALLVQLGQIGTDHVEKDGRVGQLETVIAAVGQPPECHCAGPLDPLANQPTLDPEQAASDNG